MLRKLIYILFLVSVSCIDPYNVEIEEGQQLLTIDGMVTTGPGPHVVKLTRSDTYGSIYEGLIRPVQGATMVIRDDQGRVVFLEENSERRGTYETPANFSAELGRSYTLQIQLVTGEVYSSLPERVESVPEIKNLSIQTVQIPVEGEILFRSGAQIYAEIEDPGDQKFLLLEKCRIDFYLGNPTRFICHQVPKRSSETCTQGLLRRLLPNRKRGKSKHFHCPRRKFQWTDYQDSGSIY